LPTPSPPPAYSLPFILLEVPTDPVAQLQVMAVVPALAFRAYFNTIMAQASAVATAFMVSRANYAGRFSLWQVQSATMAGAVAISSAAPMLNNPWGALMTGAVVGVLHVITVNIVSKVRFFAIRDASAVVATHLVPGVIAATASAIAAARVTPGMGFGSTQTAVMIFDGRDVKVQGGYQVRPPAVVCRPPVVAGRLFTVLD
jgi:phosphatidylserine synthase